VPLDDLDRVAVWIQDHEGQRVVELDGIAAAEDPECGERCVGGACVAHLEREERALVVRGFAPAVPEELHDGVSGDEAAQHA